MLNTFCSDLLKYMLKHILLHLIHDCQSRVQREIQDVVSIHRDRRLHGHDCMSSGKPSESTSLFSTCQIFSRWRTRLICISLISKYLHLMPVLDLQRKQQVENTGCEFFDSAKSSCCVPLRQELPVICYGGTV